MVAVTLADLRERIAHRIADAEAMHAMAPVADILKMVHKELGHLSNGKAPRRDQEPEKLLTAQQVAETLNVTPRWVYDHADSLPFMRRVGSRSLRFSSRGLEKYLAQPRP